ncbi:hypothetical protein PV04_03589 [Phialophora macrospora]|uniref:tRNA(Phe) 7-[(3-amino-3-carboxypropyl)-4-demethylwyosine(37)-N(4)]-methyltransferase n=1 Tax=Phialophora macrospora TaxID=1851006 RepID=A0A0D2FY90_9EURO|nr:hypothetical protein PV04_03589 [Phialophora macrospora]
MTRPPAIPNPNPISPSFLAKKSQILQSLNRPNESYTDNSPKGTVDAQIRDLIAEINAYEGFVTTSSCAGRVAAFVEGPRPKCKVASASTSTHPVGEGGEGRDFEGEGKGEREREDDVGGRSASIRSGMTSAAPTTSPGGKGGGRWLFVSHDRIAFPGGPPHTTTTTMTDPDPLPDPDPVPGEYFSRLFNLDGAGSGTGAAPAPLRANYQKAPPRLIHLTFSPLILHIHCASLLHARPLLAAAINAGFRESGVQSLRVLDPAEADKGVMVAVRTAGLGFDTVVGYVAEREDEDGHEGTIHQVVGEEYLRMCVEVVNERFGWNEERRERFRAELKRAMQREGMASGLGSEEVDGQDQRTSRLGWEDKEARRRRKREEGLAMQMRKREEGETATEDDTATSRQVDMAEVGLNMLETG